MSSVNIILILLFSFFAGAYTWAMRGTVIGGEKGSLLPGALLGAVVSLLTNHTATDDFAFFCAVGAFSMFQGGSATYGETINFTLRSEESGIYNGKFKKGLAGVFISGGNWFSQSALFLSIALNYKKGLYGSGEILSIFILLPFIQHIGELIFNEPYDKENEIFPKAYFSVTRREEWGTNLLVIITLLIYSLIKGDFVTIICGVWSYLCGGFGFACGLLLFNLNNKGKIFKLLNKKKLVDGWKLMEHSFGAIAFLGTSIIFLITRKITRPVSFVFKLPSNLFKISGNAIYLIPIIFLIYILFTVFELIYNKKAKKELSSYLSDRIMRILFAVLPLLLVFIGGNKTALAAVILFVNYALFEKCFNGFFKKLSARNILCLSLLLWTVIITVATFVKLPFSQLGLIAALVIPYELCTVIKQFSPEIRRDRLSNGIFFWDYYQSTAFNRAVMLFELTVMAVTYLLIK